MLVTIHQHPPGPIPPYPDGEVWFPPVWSDPIYEKAVTFSVTVEDAPAGYELTYRWVVVIEPHGYRRSLRALTVRPPGPPAPYGAFAPFPEVWLAFGTRVDLDPGKSRIEFDRVYVECE